MILFILYLYKYYSRARAIFIFKRRNDWLNQSSVEFTFNQVSWRKWCKRMQISMFQVIHRHTHLLHDTCVSTFCNLTSIRIVSRWAFARANIFGDHCFSNEAATSISSWTNIVHTSYMYRIAFNANTYRFSSH